MILGGGGRPSGRKLADKERTAPRQKGRGAVRLCAVPQQPQAAPVIKAGKLTAGHTASAVTSVDAMEEPQFQVLLAVSAFTEAAS